MTSLLILAILIQEPALLRGGSVSGQIRLTSGQSPDLVRVAAIPLSEVASSEGNVLVGIGQTDSSGRFRLDGIPPGRYYIMAGFIEAPTYYPGVKRIADARTITVASDSVVAGIDFAIEPTEEVLIDGRLAIEIRGEVITETGGGLPPSLSVSARTADNSRDGMAVAYVGPDGKFRLGLKRGEHRITVTRLPLNSAVQSISYATQDLMQSPLRVTGVATDTITIKIRITPPENTFKVSGRVKNLPARIFGRRPGVRLMPPVIRTNGAPIILAQRADAPINDDDTFEFLNVSPGKYQLTFTGFDEAGLSSQEVLVSDQDVHVDLELRQRTEIIARVAVVDERGDALPNIPPPSRISLYFTSPSLGMFGSGLGQRLDPGEYTVSVRDIPSPFSLRSVSSASTDILKAPFKVDLSPTPVQIEIVLEYRRP